MTYGSGEEGEKPREQIRYLTFYPFLFPRGPMESIQPRYVRFAFLSQSKKREGMVEELLKAMIPIILPPKSVRIFNIPP
jgi:hypothetical protein